ncbi:MAG TPA: cytochrome c [Acidisarcina sp.]|nr:cytochrome c [Acidisarcina sp.]
MTNRIQRFGILGLMVLATGTMSFAQGTGEATYKAKCQMCHGATGTGDTPAGKAMKVVPFTKSTVADMTTVIKNGKGKMPSYNGKLTDAQIKDVATYIHTSLVK